MGNWILTVRGCGQHHNDGDPNDANERAMGFVRHLCEHGQTITAATFAHDNVLEKLPYDAVEPLPDDVENPTEAAEPQETE